MAIAAGEDFRLHFGPAGAKSGPLRGIPVGPAVGASRRHIGLAFHPLNVLGGPADLPPHHEAVEIAVTESVICVPESFQAGCTSMFTKKNVGEAVDVGAGGHGHPASVNGQILPEV